MDRKKKLLVLAISLGVIGMVVAWIFTLQNMLNNGDDTLQADILQGPDETDTLFSGNDSNDPAGTERPNETDKSDATYDFTDPLEQTKPEDTPPERMDPVSVLLPPFVDPQQFDVFRKDVYKEYGVLARPKHTTSREQYYASLRIELSREDASAAPDIILLPTDRVDSFAGRGVTLRFQQSIAPLFHTLFTSLINNSSFTFIPFAIDPVITIHHTSLFQRLLVIGLPDIQSELLTPRKQASTHIPFLFGIDDMDIAMLAEQKEVYPGYLMFLSLAIDQSVEKQEATMIDFFLRSLGWDHERFQKVSIALNERIEKCQLFPRLCFIVYDLTDISFGFLSDREQLHTTFGKDIVESTDEEGFTFSNYPHIATSYPVRGWGWVIREGNPQIDSATTWIRGYLDLLLNDRTQIRSYLLAPHNEGFQREIIQTRYASLAGSTHRRKLIQGDLDIYRSLFEDSTLIPMLEGTYNKIIYLRSQ